jgi:glycerol-3-phosphate dehydrogenase (NAD(P)+)
MSPEEATKASNGVAEGVPTTTAMADLGKKLGVATPLASAMSRVLSEGLSCGQMLDELFASDISAE